MTKSQRHQEAKEGVAWVRTAAEQGDAEAQYNLGIAYAKGRGVTQNYDKAVYWWRKGAVQGEPHSQCHLGIMYVQGTGVPQSDSLAMEWARKAVDQGHDLAQYSLALMYETGKGVPRVDASVLTAAATLYRKAADQGNAPAQHKLGCMYLDGRGVAQDLSEALRLLCKAQAANDPRLDGEEVAAAIQTVMRTQRQQQQGATSPPPPPPSSETATALPPIGTRVELRGLKAKPELNGRRGVVTAHVAESGRCRVQVDDGRGVFSLKPANLATVRGSHSAGSAPPLRGETVN